MQESELCESSIQLDQPNLQNKVYYDDDIYTESIETEDIIRATGKKLSENLQKKPSIHRKTHNFILTPLCPTRKFSLLTNKLSFHSCGVASLESPHKNGNLLKLQEVQQKLPLNKYEEKYIEIENIGKGQQSICKKLKNKVTGEICVGKIYQTKDEEIVKLIKNEIEILKQCKGVQGIAQIVEEMQIEESDSYVIILKQIHARQLCCKLKFKIEQIIDIARQLLTILSYLHEHNIIHRDLHFANILIDWNLNVTLIDFGLSKAWKEGYVGLTPTGLYEYRAPEMINFEPYNEKIDCLKLNIVLVSWANYYILDQELKDDFQTVQLTLSYYYGIQDYRSFRDQIPQEFQELIGKMLIIEQKDRISSRQALDLLDLHVLKYTKQKGQQSN